MKPIEVELASPVTYKGTTYDKLTFRVPTYGDIKALKMFGTKEEAEDPSVMYEHVLQYAERLCTTIPKEAFSQVTAADCFRISEAITPLFGVPSMD